MPTLVTDCPHCETTQIALRVVHTLQIGSYNGLVYLFCPHCKLPSCAAVTSSRQQIQFQTASNSDGSFNSNEFQIDEIWPNQKKLNIPEALPEAVARAMKQAEANFPKSGHEEAAGVMYRRALELGLKAISPELSGSLAKRIEILGSQGRLTSALVDWSGQIRVLGNESAHDEEMPDRKELAALRGLTDMVLQYLFSIPALVNQRRADTEK